MSYLFFAVGLYLSAKCCWEIYLYFFDRSMFERLRAKVEDGELGDFEVDGNYQGEDIKSPVYLFIAYPFLIGACFMIGYLIYVM